MRRAGREPPRRGMGKDALDGYSGVKSVWVWVDERAPR
jgi:hypothetical protein